MDGGVESSGGVVVPRAERSEFDGVAVRVVDGGVLAAVVAVDELAPAGVGHVAHVQRLALGLVERFQRPVPAGRGLPAGAADVHVPARQRVVGVGGDAFDESADFRELAHGHGFALVFEGAVVVEAAVRAPAGDEPVVPEHVGVVVAVHFDFQSEGERLADGPSLVRVPVAGVLRVRAGVPFVAVGAVAFVALLAVFLAVRAQAVVAHAAPVPAVLAQAVLAVLAVVCAVPAHPRTAFVACARAVVAYSVAAPAFDGFRPRAVLA